MVPEATCFHDHCLAERSVHHLHQVFDTILVSKGHEHVYSSMCDNDQVCIHDSLLCMATKCFRKLGSLVLDVVDHVTSYS